MKQDRFNFNRRQSFGNIPQYGLIKGTIAPGFVDYGAVLSKTMDISSLIADRKLKESEYAENIENSPSDIDVAKIPDAYESILTDYLTDLKMNYSEGARLLRDNKVGSEAYKRGQELMRSATSEIANLDKEFTALQAASLEDIKNIQQDMYSDGNDENNQINTGSMLLKGQWSPDKMYFKNGKIFLKGGGDDGEDIAFSDLRLRFLKDGKSMSAITTTYRKIADASAKTGRKYSEQLDGALINDILTSANSQGLRSLAYDYNFPYMIKGENDQLQSANLNYVNSDAFEKITNEQFNGDKNWVRDVNNSDVLRGELLNYFNSVFKTAINEGADGFVDLEEKKLDLRGKELDNVAARIKLERDKWAQKVEDDADFTLVDLIKKKVGNDPEGVNIDDIVKTFTNVPGEDGSSYTISGPPPSEYGNDGKLKIGQIITVKQVFPADTQTVETLTGATTTDGTKTTVQEKTTDKSQGDKVFNIEYDGNLENLVRNLQAALYGFDPKEEINIETEEERTNNLGNELGLIITNGK
tara:strand:+ start:3593 stop:5173 length:1581 start_codon:yes stop_codon:yes gene_type:complete